jgi:Transposase and inactivated derivatives, IS30 family
MKFNHLTFADRLKLEALLKAKISKREIANILQVHVSTIYREVRRGRYEHLNSDWTVEERYSPDKAQEKYENSLAVKGIDIKIGNDYKLAERIEEIIIKEGYSPAATLAKIRREEKPRISICVTTLYSYIEKGVFFLLTNKALPVKRKEKRSYKKVVKQQRANRGDSIEKRSEEVKTRKEFGHWEMDTVVGKRGESKKALLVLTERMTRKEIIILMKRNTTKEVVRALDRLERKEGKYFRSIFKTITVDNGSEFADCDGMECSRRSKKKRTKLYYCHPYSSWERGTNENQNKLIRRHIPKGSNFDKKTQGEIKRIEEWINNYPRRLFGYKTAEEMYRREIRQIA